MMFCKICGSEHKNLKGLGCHIGHHHKETTSQLYYDLYYKKEGEDNCKNPKCNNKTNCFKGVTIGYRKVYCSVKCSKNSDEVQKKFEDNFLKNHGTTSPFNNPKIQKKIAKTNTKRHGSSNPFNKKHKSFKKKEETLIKNYGFNTPSKSENIKVKIRETNEELGRWLPLDQHQNYIDYVYHVNRITKQNKKELFKNWDGYDYYSGEYIKNNFKLRQQSPKYPTIDHKICIRIGFENNIDYNIIANIDNLCITTRSNNAKKRIKTEKEFKKIMNEKSNTI